MHLHSTAKTNSPLDDLRTLVSEELEQINSLIFSLIENKLSLITDISNHTFSAGGKRLRPMLTLGCAELCNYPGTAHVSLAAAVEFIHTATLLHDDVVDESNLRRGLPTANANWGNKESILVGDFLLGKAFELMGDANSVEVYKILSNAAMTISEGEVFQLSATANITLTQEEYFEIIKGKTGALFAAACEVSGAVATISSAQQEALRTYGMNLGIAFQIIDDALDYSSANSTLGKNIGDDFREKKVTLPIIQTYKNANDAEKALLASAFSKENTESEQLPEIIALLEKHQGIEHSIDIAAAYTKKAYETLDENFEDTPIKQTLLQLLEFIVQRNF